MKILGKLMLGIVILSMIACESDELITTASGDAYIRVKSTEQDTVFGLTLRAISNKNFKSVSVAPHEVIDIAYELSSNQGYKYDFFYETEEGSYGTELPQTGRYTFSAFLENDEQISFSDDLTDDIVYPATIVECAYDEVDEEFDIEWEQDEHVDVYAILIYNDQEELVYARGGINPQNTSINIEATTNGWLNNYTPLEGTEYRIQIEAYLLEAVKANTNIQCVSTISHTATWGS